MKKEEMKEAWEQQWRETKEVYNYCKRMIEFHEKFYNQCLEKELYDMAAFHKGAKYELQEVLNRIDKVLYKDI